MSSKTSGGRKVPLQVLHLSMPRTGSISMKAAYQELGLPTYHGFDYMEHPDHQMAWEKAIRAKYQGKGKPFGRKEFDSFLGDYAVLSDFPVVGFAEELLDAYPEAKVVLVERDIDTWFTSFDNGVISALYTWPSWILMTFIDPLRGPKPAITMRDLQYGLFQCSDHESFRQRAKPTYREHYAKLRAIIPKERLLEYRLGSGWEPLCKFLGKEVPQKPFPHLNERTEFAIWMRDIQLRELKRGLRFLWKNVGIPVIGFATLYVLWRAFAG